MRGITGLRTVWYTESPWLKISRVELAAGLLPRAGAYKLCGPAMSLALLAGWLPSLHGYEPGHLPSPMAATKHLESLVIYVQPWQYRLGTIGAVLRIVYIFQRESLFSRLM